MRYLSAASTLTMVIYDQEFAEVARGMDARTLSLRELLEAAAQEGRRALDKPPSTPGRVTMLTAGGGPAPRGVRRDTEGMIENLVAFLDAVDLRIGDVVTELRVPRQVLFVDALPRNDMGRVIGDGSAASGDGGQLMVGI